MAKPTLRHTLSRRLFLYQSKDVWEGVGEDYRSYTADLARQNPTGMPEDYVSAYENAHRFSYEPQFAMLDALTFDVNPIHGKFLLTLESLFASEVRTRVESFSVLATCMEFLKNGASYADLAYELNVKHHVIPYARSAISNRFIHREDKEAQRVAFNDDQALEALRIHGPGVETALAQVAETAKALAGVHSDGHFVSFNEDAQHRGLYRYKDTSVSDRAAYFSLAYNDPETHQNVARHFSQCYLGREDTAFVERVAKVMLETKGSLVDLMYGVVNDLAQFTRGAFHVMDHREALISLRHAAGRKRSESQGNHHGEYGDAGSWPGPFRSPHNVRTNLSHKRISEATAHTLPPEGAKDGRLVAEIVRSRMEFEHGEQDAMASELSIHTAKTAWEALASSIYWRMT